jgi:hypothetical protein
MSPEDTKTSARKHIFLTYGDERYTNAKQRIKKEALDLGFDETHVFGPNDISDDFKHKTRIAFAEHRGGGFWIWKPCVLKEGLARANYGDVVVYCDAGCKVQKSGKKKYGEYIDMLKNSEHSILSFVMGHEIYKWTKKDVLDYFDIKPTDVLYTKGQMIGGIIILIKTKYTEDLINEYYHIAVTRPDLFTDSQSQPNQEGFVDHRHDQSIFCILRYLRGSVLVPDTTFSANLSALTDEPFLATRKRDFWGRVKNKLRRIHKKIIEKFKK